MSKFYKTIVQIEVLSTEEIGDVTLNDIVYMITDGHCSGHWEIASTEEITAPTMAQLLINQGSDPEFLGLDEDGNDISEDYNYEEDEADSDS